MLGRDETLIGFLYAKSVIISEWVLSKANSRGCLDNIISVGKRAHKRTKSIKTKFCTRKSGRMAMDVLAYG